MLKIQPIYARNENMLAFASFAVLGLFFAFRPTLLSGFAWMQADPGDPRLSQYILEHSYRWVRGDALHRVFWNSPFFFPMTNVSAYTDLHLGTAPLYWLFRWMGLLPDTSTQLWLIVLALLNYAVAYAFLRRLFSFRPLACGLGAFIFAFSSPRICQIGHYQLFEQFWTLTALWAVIAVFKPRAFEMSDRQERAWIWVFFTSVVLQLYSAFYLGWFLAFGLYLCCWVAAFSPGARNAVLGFLRRRWITLLAATVLSAATLWPMAEHFLRAAHQLGMKHFDEVEYYTPRLPSWLYLGTRSWLYSWLNAIPFYHWLPAKPEQELGIGFVTTYLIVRTLFRNRRSPIWNYFWIVGILLFALSTRVQPFFSWPWFIAGYKGFPGGGAIRSVGRIELLLLVPAMVALAWFFNEPRGWRTGLLVALVVLEQGQWLTSFNKIQARQIISSVAQSVSPHCQSFYLVSQEDASSAGLDLEYQIDAMLASLDARVPTVNGYSGNEPPGWSLRSRTFEVPDATIRFGNWLGRHGLNPESSCLVQTGVRRIRTQVEEPAHWFPWRKWSDS